MKTLKKLISFIIATVLVIALIPFSSGVNAKDSGSNDTVVIYASKIAKETSDVYRYDAKTGKLGLSADSNIEFVIDQDVSFTEISPYTNRLDGKLGDPKELVLKGSNKLTAQNGFYVASFYTQESGTNVFVGGEGLSCESITISSGASLTVNCNNLDEYGSAVTSYYNFNSYGNLNVTSNAMGVKSTSQGVYFLGGEYHITAGNHAIQASGVYIHKSRLYLSAKKFVVIRSWNSITVDGGYIESNIEDASSTKGYSNFMADEGIKINDPMYIKTPADGYVKSPANMNDYYSIVDKDGNYPAKVVISCAEEDARIAAEEAAKKAAEEAAAKKAAEEAAKKAAEEAAKKAAEDAAKNAKKYSNEWVNGKWYNADGTQTYAGTLEWKCNSTGWWVEDTSGWYPVSQWQKIDGKWYYFLDSGYMDYSEYRDGYWLGADGAVVDGYQGEWKSDSKGWWFEDTSGWYPQSQWLWINGKCYYFESDGYLATNKYVDGYWVGADGASQ